MIAKSVLKNLVFNDLEEFLAEIQQDHDRIERQILRLTVRRRYGNPFVTISVVATAMILDNLVKLDHRIGEVFAGDEKSKGLESKIQIVLEKLTEAGKTLGLDVRAGVYG